MGTEFDKVNRVWLYCIFFFIAAKSVGRMESSGKEWRLAAGERNFHLKAIEMIHILFDMKKAFCFFLHTAHTFLIHANRN